MKFAGDFSSLIFLDPQDAEDRHDCPFCGRAIGAGHAWAVITWNNHAYLAHSECPDKFTTNPETFSNHDDENDTYGVDPS